MVDFVNIATNFRVQCSAKLLEPYQDGPSFMFLDTMCIEETPQHQAG